MKKTLFLISFPFLFSLLIASTGLSEQASGPVIMFEEKTYDAKEIKSSEYIEHTFKVYNKGTGTLEISDVKASCGCTAVNYDKTILPGQTGSITLKVNIKGRTGSIEKTARVYSNDTRNSEETLTVKAFIKESIRISSKTVRFKGEEGAVQTQSVDIIAQEQKPLSIKPGVFSLQEKMTYSIEETEKGKAFKIVFKNMPQPAGRFSGYLNLMTNYDDTPEIKITISCNFSGDKADNEKKQ
jgi:hypothetical protein